MILKNTISFSGLDGSGKTTLISSTKSNLEDLGYEVEVLTMYDHASFYAVLRNIRDYFSNRRNMHKDIKLDENIESKRSASYFYKIVRSKNFKRVIFLLDLLTLLIIKTFYVGNKKILLMDRYLYDFLVDLLDDDFDKDNIKRIIKFMPQATLSVFVDVPGDVAYSRKYEYDVPYLNWRRTAYNEIFSETKSTLIIDNTNELSLNLEILSTKIKGLISDQR